MFALISLVLCASSVARAEYVPVDSVEWLVASSDTIVRGKIIEVDRAARRRGFLVDEIWDKVTVRVAETLRGEKQEKVCFVIPNRIRAGGEEPAQMEAGEREYLFLLVRRKDMDKKEGPVRFADCLLAPRKYLSRITLSADQPVGIPTMDFKLLIHRKDVLKAVRTCAAIDRERKTIKATWLWMPQDTEACRKLEGSSGGIMVVPADHRLEVRAKKWFESKSLEYRRLGAGTLAKFKSDENIRLMKSLLTNPESEVGRSGGKITRYYPLRRIAYDALERWEIKVKEPVTMEPLDPSK
jgi:hypothetical protein